MFNISTKYYIIIFVYFLYSNIYLLFILHDINVFGFRLISPAHRSIIVRRSTEQKSSSCAAITQFVGIP